MLPLLTLVPLFLFTTTTKALNACVVTDIYWNLLAFGFNGKDYNAGTKDTWASGSPTDITATGRPPFDSNNLTCYLSQFGNAIYFVNADTSDSSAIYIYDATAKSWSKQATTPGKFDYSNFVGILDHDTDFFYALSNNELYRLNMSVTKTATSSPYAWEDVGAPPFNTQGYAPVMGLADNHVHFIDVPSNPAGSVNIFVIHFSFFQPAIQKYGDFPNQHGQTASIFLDEGWQLEFVYVPDDGSQTYVISTVTNTTQTLAGPPVKDAGATYFSSPDSIIQLAPSGAISYLPYNVNDTSANSAAAWTSVKSLASISLSSSSGGGSTGGGSGGGSSTGSGGSQTTGAQKGQQTGNTSSGGGNPQGGGAASSRSATMGMTGALLLGTIALMLA